MIRFAHIVQIWRVTTGRHADTTDKFLSLMTTLVAIEIADRVVFAADSQITEDNQRTIATTTPKLIPVGQYILGIVGDSRPGDILAYNWKPPSYKGADPVQWMGKKVMPSILAAFKENGYDPFEAVKEKDAGFDYLVSFSGNVFHIATDLSFIKSDIGIYGLGSGGAYAIGYLYAHLGSFRIANVERHARKAVEIASILDINTCPPIQLATQLKGH